MKQEAQPRVLHNCHCVTHTIRCYVCSQALSVHLPQGHLPTQNPAQGRGTGPITYKVCSCVPESTLHPAPASLNAPPPLPGLCLCFSTKCVTQSPAVHTQRPHCLTFLVSK